MAGFGRDDARERAPARSRHADLLLSLLIASRGSAVH